MSGISGVSGVPATPSAAPERTVVADAALVADVEAALSAVQVDGQPGSQPRSLDEQIAEARERLADARTAALRSRRLGDAALLLELHGLPESCADRVVAALEHGTTVTGALYIGAGLLPAILRRPSLREQA